MKKKFTQKIRTVLILAVVLTVVIAIGGTAAGFDLPGMAVKAVLTPIRAAIQGITDSAEDLYSYMFRYETILAENQELKEQMARMEDDARTADALKRENERLRELLELTQSREDFVLVDANVIGWDSTDWTSAFTINRGEGDGMVEGQCVITANGEVVGLITEAGPNYAVVKSVLDSSLEISATIAASGYNGMVQGGYAIGEEGLLHMDFLPNDAVIRNRDQVVTSGSTVYPKDLILGHVVDAGFDEAGVSKYAILEPAADFGSLEQVFVVTQFDAE